MSGAKIQRVKDTLQIFLRSLPLGTLFNVSLSEKKKKKKKKSEREAKQG
jgi:hypothetical protein